MVFSAWARVYFGHVLDPRVVGVDVDRGEHHLAGQRAQVVVGLHELRRHDRADVGAVRVHELEHHDLAAQAGQAQRVAVLVGQGEAGRPVRGQRAEHHQVGQAGGHAGRDAGHPGLLRGQGGVVPLVDQVGGDGHGRGQQHGERAGQQRGAGQAAAPGRRRAGSPPAGSAGTCSGVLELTGNASCLVRRALPACAAASRSPRLAAEHIPGPGRPDTAAGYLRPRAE